MTANDPTSATWQPELSVVVLCYRTEDFAWELAAQVTTELTEAELDYELVLVGNYMADATDKTPAVLKQIAQDNPRCKVVAKEKEGMMGWDMRSGMEAATGRHIAIIDGDGQMPTSDVVKVYRVLQAGSYDLVKTFRAQRYDGFYRKTISSVYNLLFRLLFPSTTALRDINSKPKIITRAAYEKLHLVSSDWFTDAEIMIEAIRNNLSIGEVSCIFHRNERRTSFVPPSAILEFLHNLIHYRFSRKNRG